MDKFLKDSLIAHGLDPNATDQEAQQFFDSLSAEQRHEVDGTKASLAAKAAGTSGTVSLQTVTQPTTRMVTDAGADLIRLENTRVSQIGQLAKLYGLDETFVQLQIGKGHAIAEVKKDALAAVAAKSPPVSLAVVREGEVQKVAMLATAMPDSILLRSNPQATFYDVDAQGRVIRDEDGKAKRVAAHAEARKYTGLSVLDMYRHWLIALGADRDEVHMLSRSTLAELMGHRALQRRFPKVAQLAQSTSDFANVILDAQNKSMRIGYVEAPRTWPMWAKRATAPDFKNINRLQISEVPTLTVRGEGKEINYVTLGDSKEVYVLQEFTGGVKLTRRILINDDQDVFSTVPQKQGNAAARLEEDTAYYVILKNAALADTGALFNSTAIATPGGHNNIVTSGGAPTVVQVAATEKLIMLQKGPKNAAILNLVPKFCLVPVALKTVAEQFFASRVDPTKSNDTPNPYQGKMTVVPNARFDNGVLDAAGSSVLWYLLADYKDGQIDTVEVCFLNDEPEPVLKQETDFDTDDVKYAIRHTVAAKALDFRGMARNAGQ